MAQKADPNDAAVADLERQIAELSGTDAPLLEPHTHPLTVDDDGKPIDHYPPNADNLLRAQAEAADADLPESEPEGEEKPAAFAAARFNVSRKLAIADRSRLIEELRGWEIRQPGGRRLREATDDQIRQYLAYLWDRAATGAPIDARNPPATFERFIKIMYRVQ